MDNNRLGISTCEQDLQLVWQASVVKAPVCLTVTKLGSQMGMVCSLDEEGTLSAYYQGTDPPTSSVLASDTKELNYAQIDQEHRELLQVCISLGLQTLSQGLSKAFMITFLCRWCVLVRLNGYLPWRM